MGDNNTKAVNADPLLFKTPKDFEIFLSKSETKGILSVLSKPPFSRAHLHQASWL